MRDGVVSEKFGKIVIDEFVSKMVKNSTTMNTRRDVIEALVLVLESNCWVVFALWNDWGNDA